MPQTFKVFHADHGITEAQMSFIQSELAEQADGFFIRQITLPMALGTVPCGLWGPAMGDPAIADSEVTLEHRGNRPWADKLLIGWPMRPVNYVQCIGIRDGDSFTLFTAYGGPLAPQNPADPSCKDPEEAKAFWAAHALATGQAEKAEQKLKEEEEEGIALFHEASALVAGDIHRLFMEASDPNRFPG